MGSACSVPDSAVSQDDRNMERKRKEDDEEKSMDDGAPKIVFKAGGASRLETFEALHMVFNSYHTQDIDEDTMRKVFNTLDVDGNGNVSREEFRSAARIISMVISEDEIKAHFDKIDTDKSGTIEYEEFSAAVNAVMKSRPVDLSKDDEVKSVQASFRDLMANEEAVKVFYDVLTADPAMHNFETAMDDRLNRLILHFIRSTISSLDKEKNLVSTLRDIGAFHMTLPHPVYAEQYSAITVALFAALKKSSGEEWTPELESAWRSKWRMIVDNFFLGALRHMIVDGKRMAASDV